MNICMHDVNEVPDKVTYENRIKAVLADKKKTNKWLQNSWIKILQQ